jgi:cytochrome c5
MVTFGFVKTCAVGLAIAAATLSAIAPLRAQFPTLPQGPGRDLVEVTCGSCHDIEMVAINGRTEERWGLTIDEMVGYGLRLSPDDRALILRYLATYLPAK